MAKSLECRSCSTLLRGLDDSVESITCHACITEMLQEYDYLTIPKPKSTLKEGYPKGWKFMKVFVHSNGTVYFKGVEQPDLKGSYDATPIASKAKKSRAQKREERESMLTEYNKLKTDLKKETRKTYKKKIEIKLKKLQKQL